MWEHRAETESGRRRMDDDDDGGENKRGGCQKEKKNLKKTRTVAYCRQSSLKMQWVPRKEFILKQRSRIYIYMNSLVL